MMSAAIPKHVAIIPDGNTRWAKSNGVSNFEGYRLGSERGLEIMRHARESGIHTLTFWGLSTENWRNRPGKELDFLVKLFSGMIERYLKEAVEHKVRVVHLGNKNNLPKALIGKVEEAVETTRDNTDHVLNMALDYGGQDEILRATQKIIIDVTAGRLDPEELGNPIGEASGVVPTVYSRYLDTGDQPYPFPDFIIRTSGEMRTSGFMPWQSAYAELYFEPCYWPDFDAAKFDAALANYQTRQRRFGGGHEEE